MFCQDVCNVNNAMTYTAHDLITLNIRNDSLIILCCRGDLVLGIGFIAKDGSID